MSTIRCPKCRLINLENTRRCRRCKTVLLKKTSEKLPDESLPWYRAHALRYAAIPVLALLLALSVHAIHRYSKGDLISGSSAIEARKAGSVALGSPGLEELKALHQDLKARLDRNLSGRQNDALSMNQTLVSDTLTQVGDLQQKYNNREFQKYSADLSLLLNRYHDLISQYGTEIAQLTAEKERINGEIELVRQDRSLPPEQRAVKQAELRKELANQYRGPLVGSKDLDDALRSLQNFSIPDKGN